MFKNRVAELAEEKGFRHNFLAKQCEVTPQTFSSWAKNKSQPDLKQSAILARIFNVSLDELVKWEEEE